MRRRVEARAGAAAARAAQMLGEIAHRRGRRPGLRSVALGLLGRRQLLARRFRIGRFAAFRLGETGEVDLDRIDDLDFGQGNVVSGLGRRRGQLPPLFPRRFPRRRESRARRSAAPPPPPRVRRRPLAAPAGGAPPVRPAAEPPGTPSAATGGSAKPRVSGIASGATPFAGSPAFCLLVASRRRTAHPSRTRNAGSAMTAPARPAMPRAPRRGSAPPPQQVPAQAAGWRRPARPVRWREKPTGAATRR